ncbi:MAG: hypothetical protein GEU94_01460 [Micromonosporaceae bacterium]|nr:hypothetical protein [Micromonosporaceae bacterium]
MSTSRLHLRLQSALRLLCSTPSGDPTPLPSEELARRLRALADRERCRRSRTRREAPDSVRQPLTGGGDRD